MIAVENNLQELGDNYSKLEQVSKYKRMTNIECSSCYLE